MLETSVPSHMPLVPFKLLPHSCSAGMSLSKSMCGPFKRNCLGIQQFLPPTHSPLVFTARSHRDLSFQYWNCGLGCLVWGCNPSLPRYPSQFLSTTHGCGTGPFCVFVFLYLCPSYQSVWMYYLF